MLSAGESYNRLGGIGVLNHEVARITGKMIILYWPPCAFACFDQLHLKVKMI